MRKTNSWRKRRTEARTHRREAKRAVKRTAETKRQRTRAQTPELWRSRVKGRAVTANLIRRAEQAWARAERESFGYLLDEAA